MISHIPNDTIRGIKFIYKGHTHVHVQLSVCRKKKFTIERIETTTDAYVFLNFSSFFLLCSKNFKETHARTVSNSLEQYTMNYICGIIATKQKR